MRSSRPGWLVVVSLLVLCFGLAADLDLWFQGWEGNRAGSSDLLSVMLGDSRRMFANNEAFQTPHVAEDAGAAEGKNQGDEENFLGKPRDWIDAFGRKFYPSR